jgi:hypothetical protein
MDRLRHIESHCPVVPAVAIRAIGTKVKRLQSFLGDCIAHPPDMRRLLVTLACALVTGAAGATHSAFASFDFVAKWGTPGSGPGQFRSPHGIDVDASGTVYVADTGNHRVQKFTPDGVFLTEWGTQGAGPGQFDRPSGVTADTLGNVYVVDAYSYPFRVQKFTSDGAFLAQWQVEHQPSDVAVDLAGDVYVVAPFAGYVAKYRSDGSLIATFPGISDGYLGGVFGLGIDPAGYVYVADITYSRIEKFTTQGTFVRRWGTFGDGPGQFQGPEDVAADTACNVYVSDASSHRIQKFTSGGSFVTEGGGLGGADGEFVLPRGIATDRSGNLYVVDSGNSRVQKLRPRWSKAPSSARVSGATARTLRVTGGNRAFNRVSVTFTGSIYTVTDADPLGVGRDCLNVTARSVECQGTGVVRITVSTGSADDVVDVGVPIPARVSGGPGNDVLTGGGAADRLTGGTGDDVLDGGPGTDTILAGSGNDTIHALDGEVDKVNCGAGTDVVIADPFDVLSRNCEELRTQ